MSTVKGTLLAYCFFGDLSFLISELSPPRARWGDQSCKHLPEHQGKWRKFILQDFQSSGPLQHLLSAWQSQLGLFFFSCHLEAALSSKIIKCQYHTLKLPKEKGWDISEQSRKQTIKRRDTRWGLIVWDIEQVKNVLVPLFIGWCVCLAMSSLCLQNCSPVSRGLTISSLEIAEQGTINVSPLCPAASLIAHAQRAHCFLLCSWWSMIEY